MGLVVEETMKKNPASVDPYSRTTFNQEKSFLHLVTNEFIFNAEDQPLSSNKKLRRVKAQQPSVV